MIVWLADASDSPSSVLSPGESVIKCPGKIVAPDERLTVRTVADSHEHSAPTPTRWDWPDTRSPPSQMALPLPFVAVLKVTRSFPPAGPKTASETLGAATYVNEAAAMLPWGFCSETTAPNVPPPAPSISCTGRGGAVSISIPTSPPLVCCVTTLAPSTVAVRPATGPMPVTIRVAVHPPEIPPRQPAWHTASTPSLRIKKEAFAELNSDGVTAAVDATTERDVVPMTWVSGVTAVKEVETSSDHKIVTEPSELMLPSETSSCDDAVTLGKKPAVIVTTVPPAEVDEDGSMEVMVGTWG
mmetsp:Transcript_8626/g.20064  ORF Transcript_8626/g.20064 Transcript_8626/m.20064 type:complete len:299 (-) Transcript_8626:401-1297(-)